MWTAIITACLPAAALGLVLATPDAILVAAMAITLVCVVRAVAHPPGSAAAAVAWLTGGAALGVAFLSKYPAVLIAAGVLLAVAVHPQLRAHLRRPPLYAAAVLAVVISVPMIWWNAGHDWVSFRFQIHHGLAVQTRWSRRRLARDHAACELSYIGSLAVLASPLLFGLVVGAAALASDPPHRRRPRCSRSSRSPGLLLSLQARSVTRSR
jgi:dolichol-phosphate mannosyltransferase